VKRLLRSTIDFGQTITQENLVQNFQKLVHANLEWQRPDDQRLYDYILRYFQQRLEIPGVQTVQDYFEKMGDSGGDVEVLERLKVIETAPFYIRTNYAHLLQSLLEEQNTIKSVALLKETHDIITKGVDFTEPGSREKIRKKGVREGLVHFTSKAHDLILPEYNAKTAGDIRLDGQAMWNEYVDAKNNKDKAWGKFTGFNCIDTICHGIKKGELWIHAAFAGQLKTTFALNWCYNLVTRYRSNVLYFSLEMPFEQVRRQVITIHSANGKWKAMGYKPLDYRAIRDGELTPEQEVFYQRVIEDWTTNPEYCSFEIRAPDRDMTIDDVRLEAELVHKQTELGLLVLDHGQLLEPRKSRRSKDYVVELNSIVKDAKKLALHFNHGEKLAVLMLWQINRQGYEEAIKNKGKYKPSAMSYANEVEKSADYITTSFLDDDHRRNGTTYITNLKNRENAIFEPFYAGIDFTSRRMTNQDMTRVGGAGMGVEDYKNQTDAMAFMQGL
jgi:DnaB helicase-like protein